MRLIRKRRPDPERVALLAVTVAAGPRRGEALARQARTWTARDGDLLVSGFGALAAREDDAEEALGRLLLLLVDDEDRSPAVAAALVGLPIERARDLLDHARASEPGRRPGRCRGWGLVRGGGLTHEEQVAAGRHLEICRHCRDRKGSHERRRRETSARAAAVSAALAAVPAAGAALPAGAVGALAAKVGISLVGAGVLASGVTFSATHDRVPAPRPVVSAPAGCAPRCPAPAAVSPRPSRLTGVTPTPTLAPAAPATPDATTAPASSGPGPTLPGATVPGVAVPGVTVPALVLPGVVVPGVDLPGVAVPSLAVPPLTVPGVGLPTALTTLLPSSLDLSGVVGVLLPTPAPGG